MERYQRDYLSQTGEWVTDWIPVPKPIPLRTVIRSALLNALAYTDGNQAQAAKWLEISPRVLCYQLVTYDVPGSTAGVVRRLPLGRKRKATES